jgi:nicotinamidase-related amidase
MKPVIIIVDVLQDFFEEKRLNKHQKKLTKNINELVNFGHSKNIPVIWVRQEFENDLSDAPLGDKKRNKKITIKKTNGCRLLPELRTKKSDYEIIKKRHSAFFKTSLIDLLKKLEAGILIIGGICTHACVRMTVVDAYQNDYEVILALDCVDSYDEEYHKVSLRYLTKVVSIGMRNSKIIKKFKNQKK